MAALITLHKTTGSKVTPYAQVLGAPFLAVTATFTPDYDCVARIYAQGADVTLTINNVSLTYPNGTVECIGLKGGEAVTVA